MQFLVNDGTVTGVHITQTGLVGIGATTPSGVLDIDNGRYVFGEGPASTLTLNNTSSNHLHLTLNTGASQDARIVFRRSGTTKWVLGLPYNSSDDFHIGTTDSGPAGGGEKLTVTSTGNVGIGTTTPWRTLSVNGTAAFSGLTNDGTGYYACISTSGELATSTTACGASSERFKEKIEPLHYGLDEILSLSPVSFSWKEGFIANGARNIGFIAEQVEGIIPEIIGYDSEGRVMNLDYPKLTAVLVSGMQELYGRLVDLTETVAGFADKFTTGILTFQTATGEKLCLEDICITKAELQELLERNGTPASFGTDDQSSEVEEPPVSEESDEEGSEEDPLLPESVDENEESPATGEEDEIEPEADEEESEGKLSETEPQEDEVEPEEEVVEEPQGAEEETQPIPEVGILSAEDSH